MPKILIFEKSSSVYSEKSVVVSYYLKDGYKIGDDNSLIQELLMDIHDKLYSHSSVLNEQIARQVFSILPDTGPVVVITDRQGNCWPSDSERFSELNLSDLFLAQLCNRIDDGVDYVTTQVADVCVVGSQLSTERTNCGYVFIVMPQCAAKSAAKHTDIVEVLLGLISLAATLVEKNTLLYELQLRYQDVCARN